ncbi:non-ribosomal peptide synthetase [Clostridium sp. UBA6640]|uniref:non-ribosomal peptide synthetase n=1 Tax=Clostridium sp. UBA6640 TaxID=1946370 RepID=UPI0025C559B5|nr:non-ribosomal peptide synthetase [Clostridium sp. UBA6640]
MGIKKKESMIIASEHAKEEEFWNEKLKDIKGLQNFIYDCDEVNTQDNILKQKKYYLTDEIFNKFIVMSNGSDYKLHMILVSIISILIKRCTGNDDVTIATPIYKQEVKADFINTIVILRNKIQDSMAFKDVVFHVRKNIIEANQNVNYPIDIILDKFKNNHCKLDDILVLLENIHEKEYVDGIESNLKFTFNHNISNIELDLQYNECVYNKKTIERIFEMFLTMCEHIISNTNLLVKDIEIIPQKDKNKLLYEFNKKIDFNICKSIHEFVEEHAKSIPKKVAFQYGDLEITYAELNKRANQMARTLPKDKISKDKTVAILLNRSHLMVESILAIWKLGGAYIPLNKENPTQKLLSILNNSNTKVLVTTSDFINEELETNYKGKIIKLDLCEVDMGSKDDANLNIKTNLNDLAYIIYTSGSTGDPKGAMIEHAGMMNHIYNKINDLKINEEDIIAQNASQSFDISVWQFFTGIVVGGKAVIYPNDVILNLESFLVNIIKDNISILEVVPSYLSVLIDYLNINKVDLLNLKYILVTGEELKSNLVKEWFNKYPNIKMVNCYGPTEASDDITHYIMDKWPKKKNISIGKPLANTFVHILDKNMKLCNVGVKGEICVSGIVVGRGYLNDLERTEKVFCEDLFSLDGETRLYKTGDIGKWNEDGTIEFFGREDYQVKIRGFRIELKEIENVLQKYSDIKDVVVMDRVDDNGNKYLCAYYIAEETIESSLLTEHLSEYLVNYMIPAYFVRMDKFPVSANGKIDRKVLPNPINENNEMKSVLIEDIIKNSNIKTTNKLNSTLQESLIEDGHFISSEEKSKILEEFNSNIVDYKHYKTISQLFEDAVEKYRYKIAITDNGTQITYDELNSKANQLAVILREKGVKPEVIVTIILPRSINAIISMIAILKAGGAYHVIDTDCPQERIDYFLKNSESDIVITSDEIKEKFTFNKENVQLININDDIFCGQCKNIDCINSPNDLAYVMYTSGTTGEPKGAMNEHRNLINSIYGWIKEYGLNEIEVNTLCTVNFSFDVSVADISRTLVTGGNLIICPKTALGDFEVLCRIIEDSKVTVMESTPSIILPFMKYVKEQDISLNTLKVVVVGSDLCNKNDFQNLNDNFDNKIKLINSYGVTECGVDATFYKVDSGTIIESQTLPIGKPLPNTKLYILNNKMEVQPIGVMGELFISGESVGRGYINKESLTKTKFVHDPFSHKEDQKMYKTGDIARWLPDGNIEFFGRLDYQIKINGLRIEVQEIEATLNEHNKVDNAVVVLKSNDNNGKFLCAYITTNTNVTEAELQKYLSAKLPRYMIPRYFIKLDKLPLTPNRKINRSLLIGHELEQEKVLVAARNNLEEEIVYIWQKVLSVKNISMTDDFFSYGGDSIRAIKVISLINKKFNIRLEIVDLFENSTIEKLAKKIETTESYEKVNKLKAIQSQFENIKNNILMKDNSMNNVEDIYPMSDVEKGMVYYSLMNKVEAEKTGHAVNHNQLVVVLDISEFDSIIFEKALDLMVKKHENLRTSFNVEDYKKPMKIISTSINKDFKYENILNINEQEQQKYIQNLLNEDRKKPFDTKKAPLWRIRVFSISEDKCAFWISFNQSIFDGWSLSIFIPELFETYSNLNINNKYTFKEINASYKDAVMEQILEEGKEDNIKFWINELKGYKKLDFSLLSRTCEVKNKVNQYIEIIDKNKLKKLKNIAKKYGTTVKNICFTAYVCMIKWMFDEDDIVVANLSHNRATVEDSEFVLGCFINMVPVRTKISDEVRLLEMLNIVDNKFLELKKHDKVSLLGILKIIGEKSNTENPIADTMFNFTNFHNLSQMNNIKDVSISTEFNSKLKLNTIGRPTTSFDFNVDVTTEECSIMVLSSVFNEDTIKKYIGYFIKTIDYMIVEDNRKIGEIISQNKLSDEKEIQFKTEFKF